MEDVLLANADQMTLGMRLDAAIKKIDSLSSTQLYILIVGITIVVSFLVLGSAQQPADVVPHDGVTTTSTTSTDRKITATRTSTIETTSKGPEPRWHIFRWVNFATVALFIWSVVDFTTNATIYLNDNDSSTLLKFLVGWSILLCYFFGFFGVSFVHEMTEEQQQQQPTDSVPKL